MKIEKSYLAFHIKLDWESTNMIVPVQIVFFVFFGTACMLILRKKERVGAFVASRYI